MEFVGKADVVALSNPGVVSRQLLCPKNSRGERITMTEVHLQPGASQPRHAHAASEQVWYALQGEGRLLLADGGEQPFSAGDVVRFEEGDVHGLANCGDAEFVYVSVTAPPIDFAYAYRFASRPVSA